MIGTSQLPITVVAPGVMIPDTEDDLNWAVSADSTIVRAHQRAVSRVQPTCTTQAPTVLSAGGQTESRLLGVKNAELGRRWARAWSGHDPIFALASRRRACRIGSV